MKREDAIKIWDAFTAQHGGDISLDAMADFIVQVAKNERRICINVAERHAEGECCVTIIDALMCLQ